MSNISFNLRSLGIVLAVASSLFTAAGCHSGSTVNSPASVLTDTKLVDQNGNTVELSSLKGKPLVVDFIYTSCPGPCLMETAKFANVRAAARQRSRLEGHARFDHRRSRT
jgi:cytochrome oxidase Cu insertion factor (SCO1/SenC/PrrC family)